MSRRFPIVLTCVLPMLMSRAIAVAACDPSNCPACTDLSDGQRKMVQVRLLDVSQAKGQATFTYAVCQKEGSQKLSHWVLALDDLCCENIVDATGGVVKPECALDPTTGVDGLKFETPDGVPQCDDDLHRPSDSDDDDCDDIEELKDPALFTVVLKGEYAVGCTTATAKIASGAQPGGCIQGPECDACALINEICFGNPGACDDCNLNGVADACDLENGILTDDDQDGIPDQCATTENASGDWSGDIWSLPGNNPYPDNVTGIPNLFVTLEGGSVLLDIDAEIETLRLLQNALLQVTQAGLGNLSVIATGGAWNQGTIAIGPGRILSIPNGPFVIGAGGQYGPPAATIAVGTGQVVDAFVQANGIVLLPTSCGATRQFELSGLMSAMSSGDFVMDGTGSIPCGGGQGSVAGGQTPPILDIRRTVEISARVATAIGPASLFVDGDMRLIESAQICIGCQPALDEVPPVVVLGRDLDNQLLRPSLVNWSNAVFVLAGGLGHRFEVAGLDLGSEMDGFGTDADALFDTAFHRNFAMKRVVVMDGEQVLFVNDQVNTAGTGSCAEALYLDELVLKPGAEITLDNVRVYYRRLVNDGGTINQVGCGQLVDLCDPAPPEPDSLRKNRYITVRTPGTDEMFAARVLFTDLPAPFDVLNGRSMWVGPPVVVSKISGFRQPLSGFGTFMAAPLQCQPEFLAADGFDELQVYGEFLVPGAQYEVQFVRGGCSTAFAESLSSPTQYGMSGFGDVAGVFNGTEWTAPDGRVDITIDATSIVDAFANRPGAPNKQRADLRPDVPDQIIDIVDVSVVIDAFRGLRYTADPPTWPCDP